MLKLSGRESGVCVRVRASGGDGFCDREEFALSSHGSTVLKLSECSVRACVRDGGNLSGCELKLMKISGWERVCGACVCVRVSDDERFYDRLALKGSGAAVARALKLSFRETGLCVCVRASGGDRLCDRGDLTLSTQGAVALASLSKEPATWKRKRKRNF